MPRNARGDALRNDPPDEATPRYRSGAVARMVQMPVSTLRVWERRYGVVQPALSPSGHRLYSAADVRRLVQLKQLTDTGHAIGSIATLDDEALLDVAATHASSLTARRAAPPAGPAPWRVVVVGPAFERRLQRAALLRTLGRPVEIVATHDELAQVGPATSGPVDALLLQLPGIGPGTLAAIRSALGACGARAAAMVYGFGTLAACEAIADEGVAVLRESQDDRALGRWLRSVADAVPEPLLAAGDGALPLVEVPPRRYTDAALTDFAALSPTIACECPRHVAELLMQLSHFEAYSAECQHQSPADAAMHAYLRRVAGTARALFETALERLVIEEGLTPPR